MFSLVKRFCTKLSIQRKFRRVFNRFYLLTYPLKFTKKDFYSLHQKEKIVLFYAFDAGVDPHFNTLCKLALAMKKVGYFPLFVKCESYFPICPVMEMLSVESGDSKAIKKTCNRCQDTFFDYLIHLGLPFLKIDSYPLINSLLDTSPKTIGENLDDTTKLVSLSDKLGYLAFSDTILNSKDSRHILADNSHYKKWSKYYESAVSSYSLADYLHSKINPYGVVYFDTYVIHQAPVLSAKEHGINAYGCKHSYPDTHNLRFDKHSIMTLKKNLHKSWIEYKEHVQTAQVVNQVFQNLNSRLKGGGTNWFYKKPDLQSNKLLEYLMKQARHKKIICVFPSSLDEIKAAMSRNLAFDKPISCSKNIFLNQVNWLEETIDYFREREDVVVVFRLHPRMGKNKRLNVVSPHYEEIMTLFSDLPKHFVVIDPEFSLSSYSLANIADLIISSGTTLGLESAAIGVPVVRAMWYYDFAFPVDEDIDGIGCTKEKHWQLIEKKLSLQKCDLLSQVKNTIRLMHYSQSAFNVASGRITAFDKPNSKSEEYLDFISYISQILEGKKNSFQYITDKMPTDNCPKTEEMAIVFELKRRIHLVITGEFKNSTIDLDTNQSINELFHNSFGELSLNERGYTYFYKSKKFTGNLQFINRVYNYINNFCEHV